MNTKRFAIAAIAAGAMIGPVVMAAPASALDVCLIPDVCASATVDPGTNPAFVSLQLIALLAPTQTKAQLDTALQAWADSNGIRTEYDAFLLANQGQTNAELKAALQAVLSA